MTGIKELPQVSGKQSTNPRSMHAQHGPRYSPYDGSQAAPAQDSL